ncbi:MAG: hypothetical protein JO353_05075 [Phycisphaerae bacterium]|nr:hypothetical protein [Phycisphaerae bacterium]
MADSPRRTLQKLFPLILIPTLGLMAGCGSSVGAGDLRFRSVESNRLFSEHFAKAYYSQSDDGDRTVVLINDGLPQAGPAEGPLDPVASEPLRQVVRFRILWNPLHGTRIDAPSTTNCVIDWIVRDTSSQAAVDSLHYQGAGYVSASQTEKGLVITVRSAALDAAARTGELADPVGRCIVNGKFIAIRDDQLVAATVARMDEMPLAEATPAAAQVPSRTMSFSPTVPEDNSNSVQNSGPPSRQPSP